MGRTTSVGCTLRDYVSYSWSNGFNTTVQSIQVTAGIYTVTVTDNNGCVGTSPSVNLLVNVVPVIAFTNDTSLTCSVPEINFTNQSDYPQGSTYLWHFGDGSTSDQSNPSHIYYQPGVYPISLEITTPQGCSAQQTSQVEILFYPLPVADFVTAPGVSNVFNGRMDFVDRSSNAVSWVWEFGDGDRSEVQNPYHYYEAVGEFKVALTVTNIAGCIDRHEDLVTINPFYIPNAFTPNGDGINDQFYYAGYDLDIDRL